MHMPFRRHVQAPLLCTQGQKPCQLLGFHLQQASLMSCRSTLCRHRDICRYDLEMGGSGLLDIGLYVVSIASWIYGGKRPDAMHAFGVLVDTGADVAGTVTMRWAPTLHSTPASEAPGKTSETRLGFRAAVQCCMLQAESGQPGSLHKGGWLQESCSPSRR